LFAEFNTLLAFGRSIDHVGICKPMGVTRKAGKVFHKKLLSVGLSRMLLIEWTVAFLNPSYLAVKVESTMMVVSIPISARRMKSDQCFRFHGLQLL
jgi:hypothetical protein